MIGAPTCPWRAARIAPQDRAGPSKLRAQENLLESATYESPVVGKKLATDLLSTRSAREMVPTLVLSHLLNAKFLQILVESGLGTSASLRLPRSE
jgi:hypothetical protein